MTWNFGPVVCRQKNKGGPATEGAKGDNGEQPHRKKPRKEPPNPKDMMKAAKLGKVKSGSTLPWPDIYMDTIQKEISDHRLFGGIPGCCCKRAGEGQGRWSCSGGAAQEQGTCYTIRLGEDPSFSPILAYFRP